MTEQTQPTDAEILDAADDFRSQPAHSGEPVAFIHWPINDSPRLVWYIQKAPNDAILKTSEGPQPDVKLYAAPQPAVREPLTDGQIAELMRDTWGCASVAPRHALEFARVVERAHGIKGKEVGNVG